MRRSRLWRWFFDELHPSWSVAGWAGGVIGGVAMMLIWRPSWFASGWWVVAGVVGVGLGIWRPCRLAVGMAVLLGVAMAGWRAEIDLAGRDFTQGRIGQEVVVVGKVMEDPDTSEGKTSYRLGELRWGGAARDPTSGVATAGQIYVSGTAMRELKRSDVVQVTGRLSDGFGTFVGMLYRPEIEEVVRPEPGDVFLAARDFLAEQIRAVIPEPESALGLGYLLGVKSSLPDGLAETLKVVGMTHIVVASGSNLSILIGYARKLFGKMSRFGGLCFSLVFVGCYVGMVGLSPSMLRAAIVSILSLAAWYVGRESTPLRLLVLVAAATLLYNPMYLIDLGWLLSFGSFAGMMIVNPRLKRFFYGEQEPGVVGGTLLESVSASLVCVPILLYFFGTMSLISLLANLLILPTISLAMGMVFATGAAQMLALSGVAKVVGVLTTGILSYHLWVINWLGSADNLVVKITAGEWWVLVLELPIVAGCIWSWRREVRRRHDPG